MGKQVRWSRIKLKDQSVWVACEPDGDQALVSFFENLLRFVPLSTRRHVSPGGTATWSVTNDLWKTRVQDELEGMGVDLVRDPAVGKRILGDNAAPGAYGTAERTKAQAEDRRRRAEEGERNYRNRADAERQRKEAERLERIRRMFRDAGVDPDGRGGFPGFGGFGDDARDAFRYAYGQQSAGYSSPFAYEPPRRQEPPPRSPPPMRNGKGPTAEDWRALFLVQGAPVEVVRAAHRALAILYHPDRGGSNEEKLKAVNVARDRILAMMGEEKVS